MQPAGLHPRSPPRADRRSDGCYNEVMAGDDDDAQRWLVAGGDDVGEIRSQYDDWAPTYDDEVDGWHYRAPEVAAGLLLEHGGDPGPVLDAGCGTGLVGQALRSSGCAATIHGADASAESLELAAVRGIYEDLTVVDLQQPLPWPDARFGSAVCVGVMTYVPDVEGCWREFARVVRPGGVVVATQRDDIWDDHATQEAIDRLADDGVWTPVVVTGPRPYLPGNADFGDEIGVRYVVMRVE